MFALLCGEPWCLPVAVVADLTDWQVENLYLRPAAARAARLRGEEPEDGEAGEDSPTASPADERAAFVGAGLQMAPGTTRDHWEREYDRLKARDEDRRGKAAGK